MKVMYFHIYIYIYIYILCDLGVTMREHLATEGETVGEKSTRILPNIPNYTLHLGIFYMP
jgi:hypothetical protein